jgi:mannose-6-phosphate isomerase-like protein (cupin superfamily)
MFTYTANVNYKSKRPSMSLFLNKRERRIIQKPWGWIDWIHNGDFCGKVIYMKKGRYCSRHYHNNTEEVAYIEDGEAQLAYQNVEQDDIQFNDLQSGDAIKIAKPTKHQL